MPEPIKLTKQVKQDMKGVIALMEANIDRIDMADWAYTRKRKDTPKEYSCGTVGCIAGYINLYHGYSEKFMRSLKGTYEFSDIKFPKKATKVDLSSHYFPGPGEIAKALMGIDQDSDLDHLYLTSQWPEPFKSNYDALLDNMFGDLLPKNYKKAGRLVIKRFKHFIKTGL